VLGLFQLAHSDTVDKASSLFPQLLRSRRIRRAHALGDLRAAVTFHHRDVVLALQVEPELRAFECIALANF
jgi:hypothetical protein